MFQWLFYKGVLLSDLKDDYIPGTVTSSFREALTWKERIESNKSKGPAKHVRHGKAVVIEIIYEGDLLSHEEFQKSGVKEHQRKNCWTSISKSKAQLNTVCKYRILDTHEMMRLYSK